MVSRNKIREIAPLDKALPNLKSLVLIENELETPQVCRVYRSLARTSHLVVPPQKNNRTNAEICVGRCLSPVAGVGCVGDDAETHKSRRARQSVDDSKGAL
jgi:hypothetical protein